MFDNRWIWINGKKEGKKKGKESEREKKKRRQAGCIGCFKSQQIKVNPVSSPYLPVSFVVLCIFSMLSLDPTPRLKMLVLFYSFFFNPLIKLTNQEPIPSFSTECLNLSTSYYSFCTSSLEFAPKLFSNLPNQSPVYGLFCSLLLKN